MAFPKCRRVLVAAITVVLPGLSALPAGASDPGMETILRKGSVEWNHMRGANPDLRPDLSGASLKGRRLPKVNFFRTNLAVADLSQSAMGYSDFREADLREAKFPESILSESVFSGADCTAADFTGAACDKADFSGARLESARLRKADFSRASLCKAALGGADLREVRLEHADLTQADMRAANLWLASVGGARFTGALISADTILPDGKAGSATWAAIHEALFVASSAMPAALQSISAPGAPVTIRNDEMLHETVDAEPGIERPRRAWRPDSGAVSYDVDQYELLRSDVMQWNRTRSASPEMTINLQGAPLSGKCFAGADLHGALLDHAVLRHADLGKANLVEGKLRGADLRAAILERADLRRADLRGANLWRANTGRARFDGALVSPETVLDNGKSASKAWAEAHGAWFSEK